MESIGIRDSSKRERKEKKRRMEQEISKVGLFPGCTHGIQNHMFKQVHGGSMKLRMSVFDM